jgi:transposase-like protein
MTKEITGPGKKAYLQTGGVRCPFCHSKDIEGHSGEFGQHASQQVSCMDCEREWIDVYKLVDVLEV